MKNPKIPHNSSKLTAKSLRQHEKILRRLASDLNPYDHSHREYSRGMMREYAMHAVLGKDQILEIDRLALKRSHVCFPGWNLFGTKAPTAKIGAKPSPKNKAKATDRINKTRNQSQD